MNEEFFRPVVATSLCSLLAASPRHSQTSLLCSRFARTLSSLVAVAASLRLPLVTLVCLSLWSGGLCGDDAIEFVIYLAIQFVTVKEFFAAAFVELGMIPS